MKKVEARRSADTMSSIEEIFHEHNQQPSEDMVCETPLEAGHHWVNFVYPAKDYGFVYTEGLYELYSHPEFIVFDVPKAKVDRVCAAMNFLAERLKNGHRVGGGQSLGSQGLILRAQLVVDEDLHRRIWDTFMCRANVGKFA